MSMESGGQREFVFPLSAAKKYGIAEQTLRRHIDELTASGFITVRSGASLRQPNIYSLREEYSNKDKMPRNDREYADSLLSLTLGHLRRRRPRHTLADLLAADVGPLTYSNDI